MARLIYKGDAFLDNSDGKHLSDEIVQKMIDDTVMALTTSKKEIDFHCQETGDTMVVGFKFLKDNEIYILVSQNYMEASLVTYDGGKTWEPVEYVCRDATEDNEEEKTMAELTKEIKELKDEIAELRRNYYALYDSKIEI